MQHYKNFILLSLLFFAITPHKTYAETPQKSADLIIFSFNRPLQLYALLQTVHKYITNLNQICILYRTTNQNYDNAYEEIKGRFPHIKFIKQGPNPRGDFKPLLLQCVFGSPVEYVMFSVDDDIVTDYVDIYECTQAMEKHGAYGFYLRAGRNLTSHYPENGPVIQPPFIQVEPNILKYQFNSGNDVWNYPNNLDMTVFKKSNLEHFFRNASYSSPNTLEGTWAGTTNLNNYGLCFNTSKKFMLALNIVQQDWYVPNENSFSVEDLFARWNSGLAIDIEQFAQINTNSFIMGYRPTFIKR